MNSRYSIGFSYMHFVRSRSVQNTGLHVHVHRKAHAQDDYACTPTSQAGGVSVGLQCAPDIVIPSHVTSQPIGMLKFTCHRVRDKILVCCIYFDT